MRVDKELVVIHSIDILFLLQCKFEDVEHIIHEMEVQAFDVFLFNIIEVTFIFF